MHAQQGNTGLTPPPQVPLASVVEETLQSARSMATALVPLAAPEAGSLEPEKCSRLHHGDHKMTGHK